MNKIFFQEFLLLQELVPDITQSKVDEEEVVVFIRNANAHITNKENVDVLHHVNLEIKSEKLYVVFGPVGSGKVPINIFYINFVNLLIIRINILFF